MSYPYIPFKRRSLSLPGGASCFFAFVLTAGVLCFTGVSTQALQAIEDAFSNSITWKGGGRIEATCYEAEGIAGVDGNVWLDYAVHRRVGQTFRCTGPRLRGVQLGIDDVDGGYVGLHHRGDTLPPMTMHLLRGGPGGDTVARKTFAAAELTSDLMLEVDEPSDPTVLWYMELEAGHQDFPVGHVRITTSGVDSYPGGKL